MRLDWTISACCHAAVLIAAVVSFSPVRLPSTPNETIAVNIVSDTDKSQLTRGAETAPPQEKPKQLVEEVGEARPVENPNAKVVPKREVTAATDAPPPPPPVPLPKAKKAEPKRDLIAETLKSDDARRPEQKKAEAKTPTPPKRPPQQQQQQPKFDPSQVAALLDKRAPQRMAATGDAINDAVAQGAPRGMAARLSQSELDALRARLAQLWNPPAGAGNPQELVVLVRMQLKRDGTLAGPPMVTSSGQSATYMAARDSAMRAVLRGQPFDMLRAETYEQWKDIEITFDPREMIRG